MAYDENLANKVREALIDIPNVEEKKMFRGITFMVNGKMCISVSGDELMCRIGADVFDEALEKEGVRQMVRGGTAMKGFVYVSPEGYRTPSDFDYWLKLSLGFNQQAKASKKNKV